MRVRVCAGCGCAARVCGRVCGSGATGQRDDLWRPYLEGGNLDTALRYSLTYCNASLRISGRSWVTSYGRTPVNSVPDVFTERDLNAIPDTLI